jgi:hypothetical protein
MAMTLVESWEKVGKKVSPITKDDCSAKGLMIWLEIRGF